MTHHRLSRIFTSVSALAVIPALAATLATAPAAALADDGDGYGDPQQAAPDPGVARVSVIDGSVDVKRGDSGDTVSASVNAPLSAGDYISTQDQSQAEIEFDYGTELRVAPDSQLRFTQLAPQDHELQLAAGTLELRLFHGADAHASVETPQATITPDRSGSYFIDVDNDGNTRVTVRSGRVQIESAAGTQSLVPGSTLAISGDDTHAEFQTIDPVSYAGFDSWIASRDRYFERASDNPYVEHGMVGTEDLYANGRWVDNAQYGQVWVPNVEAGWAPYHDGRWVWEPYYGWTWVDNEPWGWAPFHYGNWFYASDVGWAWYPGQVVAARPYVYRPALVAFFNFGGGEGAGISLNFGNIGWVPIAPNEPFHPWWGAGSRGGYGYARPAYGNTTIVNNYTNNVTIVNVYHNSNAPGGVVGVENGNFANGNFTHLHTLAPIDLRRAEPIRRVLPIVPTANNLAFRPNAPVARPLEPVARFEKFRAPVTAQRPTFVQQQRTIESSAVRAYPTHEDAITHIAPAIPEAGRTDVEPRTRYDGNASHPTYASPDRTNGEPRGDAAHPADPANPKPAPDNAFDRFGRPATPQYRPPSDATPGGEGNANYRAPRNDGGTTSTAPGTNGTYGTGPNGAATYRAPYRSSTYHSPTRTSTGYHAPAYRTHRSTANGGNGDANANGAHAPHPAPTEHPLKPDNVPPNAVKPN